MFHTINNNGDVLYSADSYFKCYTNMVNAFSPEKIQEEEIEVLLPDDWFYWTYEEVNGDIFTKSFDSYYEAESYLRRYGDKRSTKTEIYAAPIDDGSADFDNLFVTIFGRED